MFPEPIHFKYDIKIQMNTIYSKAASLLDEGFKSDKQRKAVFAKRGKVGGSGRVKAKLRRDESDPGTKVLSMGKRLTIDGSSRDGFPRSVSKKEISGMTTRHSKLRKVVARAIKMERAMDSSKKGKKRKKFTSADFDKLKAMGKEVAASIYKDKKGKKSVVVGLINQ